MIQRNTQDDFPLSAGIRVAKAYLLVFGMFGAVMTSIGTAVADVIDDREAILTIIQDVAQGWQQADEKPFRAHFLDIENARYIESGGQNTGLNDLINHHVIPEGDVLSALKLTFSDVEIHFEEGFAWAIASVEVFATVKKSREKIHNRGFETFLFRKINNSWKIIHTHSSSRPVEGKEKGHGH